MSTNINAADSIATNGINTSKISKTIYLRSFKQRARSFYYLTNDRYLNNSKIWCMIVLLLYKFFYSTI